jgi:GrpB-like predicted nucleotidyltransferase (UPF0157 family)
MIIIVNSPPGFPAGEVSRDLSIRSGQGVFIEGEYLDPHDSHSGAEEKKLEEFFPAIRDPVITQKALGYDTIVVCCSLATSGSLSRLKRCLSDLDDVIYSFRLVPADGEVIMQSAGKDDIYPGDGSEHCREIARLQEREALRGDMGYPVETGHRSIPEIAESIWQNIIEAVHLVPYDASWPLLYQAEEIRIGEALGEKAMDIQHIGSTSVPGLAAKPIIDIMVSVGHLRDALDCIEPLKRLGYVFVDYVQNRDRRFFRKGFPRTHHLHIVEQGSQSQLEHIRFRDIMRANEELRREYAGLKESLSSRFRNNRAEYSESKGVFIAKALCSAGAGACWVRPWISRCHG